MRVIIDTNLLFSAIGKSNGKIAEIILNPLLRLELIGCYFSYIELFKHKEKLLKLSKLEETEMLEAMYKILGRVQFINETQIPIKLMTQAFNLTHDIDEKDTVFVAMSLFTNCKIWSGDEILRNGLRTKGFQDIISTAELLEMLS